MHAGNHDIHLLQNRVRQIQRPIRQNIHFNPSQHSNTFQFLIHFPNPRNMLHRPRIIQSIRHRQILRMVGNGHVLVAAFPRGLRHFLNRVLPVGFDGMHVYIAAQVFHGDQLGQRMFLRRLNLSQTLAQLRRNIVQLQGRVNIFLSLTRHPFFIVQTNQAVLIQRQPHLQRPLPQKDIV